MALGHMLLERVAKPAARVRVGHPVAAEQLLLPLERQAGDGPAGHEPLEQQLAAALPAVLLRRGGRAAQLLELAQRSRGQRVAHGEHVAVDVGVLAGGDRLLRLLLAASAAASHADQRSSGSATAAVLRWTVDGAQWTGKARAPALSTVHRAPSTRSRAALEPGA